VQALIAEAMKNIDSNISAVHVEEAMDAVEDDLVDAVVEKAEKKEKSEAPLSLAELKQ